MAGSTDGIDHYAVLELDPTATNEDVLQAYDRLRGLFAEDSVATYALFGENESAEQRKRLDRAFEVLSNESMRSDYHRRQGLAAPQRSGSPNRANKASKSDSGRSSFLAHSTSMTRPPATDDVVIRTENAPASPAEPLVHTPTNSESIQRLDEHTKAAAPSEAASSETSHAKAAPAKTDHPEQAKAELSPAPSARSEASRTDQAGAGQTSDASSTSAPQPAVGATLAATGALAAGSQANIQASVQANAQAAAPAAPVHSERLSSEPSMEEASYSGGVLSRLRESAGLTLDAIAQKTKISMTHLKAIEGNVYDKLPARVYVRGFVSQYARCLGLPTERVADSYLQIYDRYHQQHAQPQAQKK